SRVISVSPVRVACKNDVRQPAPRRTQERGPRRTRGKRGLEYCGRLCSMGERIDRITRPELYAAVWNEPVTALAMRMGVSDQAVRKACAAMRIPIPPRGYWARIAAGQSSKRPELPPPKPGEAAEYRVDRTRQSRQTDETPPPQGVQITPAEVKSDLRNV